MASLPRPSRPSLPLSAQPSSPPPSIPIPKSRQSSIPASSTSIPGSFSSQPLSARTASSSSIPNSASAYTSNTSLGSATSQTSGEPPKSLRKTISYNSFPRPPTGPKTPTGTSPTSSNSTTPRGSRQGSALTNGISRSASGQSASIRTNNPSTAVDTVTSPVEEDTTADDTSRGRVRPGSSGGKDKGNVVISVRVRPEKDQDASAGGGEWMVEGKRSLISYKGKEGGEYVYDNVFTAHDKNDKVYSSAAKRLVRRVMEGYNGTVFAYGMTGTGKTYSMQGTHQHPGVTPSAITDIFSYIRETPQREFLLRVSYLEIYNERIHDLLALQPDDAVGAQQTEEIKLREDAKGNVYATPLKEELVQSPTQLLRVIARGDLARKTSSTQFNARSSRSHAVVQVVVESRERKLVSGAALDGKRGPAIPVGTRISTLSLIDLAGSERAAETKERREEGSHINRSLLTLGTVISKLSGNRDKNGQPTDKQGKHLPYRDSKLTRLLQPALAGNSLISILCTIQLGSAGSSAAAGNHVMETLNTLKFAARARNNIVSHAKRSEDHANINDAGSRALLDRYAEEIRDLKKQLEGKNSESAKLRVEEEEDQRKEEERVRNEELSTELHLAKVALGDRIKHLNALILSSKSTGVNQMRSYSSLSHMQQRMSTMSNATDSRSIRSSTSNHTLDAKAQSRQSSGDTVNGHAPSSPHADEDDDDVNGYGDASKDAQIKALQADLADKNRYIESLENRLRQARRSSKSRVSMLFQGRMLPSNESGGADVLLRDKDAEISELREQLDDSQRSLNALRSATRKRETLDLTPSATPTPTPPPVQRTSSSHSHSKRTSKSSSQASGGAETKEPNGVSREPRLSRRTSMNSNTTDLGTSNPYRSSLLASRRSSTGPSILNLRNTTASPTPIQSTSTPTPTPAPASQNQSPPTKFSNTTSPRSPPLRSPRKRNHGVDDMTRMLDDLIQAKVREQDAAREKNGGTPAPESRSNSLNLLAMRDSPFAKQRRHPRMSTSTPQAEDGLAIAGLTPGRRRESLLGRGADDGMKANGVPATPTSPGAKRTPPVSPSHRLSAKPPYYKSSTSTSSSTTAAQRATEALRNSGAQQRNGEIPNHDQDTENETENESTNGGNNTVASSTVGALTVNGDVASNANSVEGGEVERPPLPMGDSMRRVREIQAGV